MNRVSTLSQMLKLLWKNKNRNKMRQLLNILSMELDLDLGEDILIFNNINPSL